MLQLPEGVSILELVDSPTTLDAAERVLTLEERTRREAFRSASRRMTFSLGRFAVRTLLADRLLCDPAAVALQVRDDGSIGVDDDALFASISHSGSHAVAAVASSPVGVDLERIRARPESLFRYVLHPDEYGLRDVIDLTQDTQLVLFWALKEAVLKAERTGLRVSPKRLRLEQIDLGAGTALIQSERPWRARFDIHADRVVAVVW